MDTIVTFWLPIVLSAVAVFFASFLTWAILPFHNQEYKAIPGEDQFVEALKRHNVPAGDYMFPYAGCKSEKMKDPEFKAKMMSGPMGHMRVWQGAPSMGKNMFLTFIVMLVISLFVAYISSLAIMTAADGMHTFRVTTTAAFMAYAFGGMCNAIWFGKSLRGFTLDAIDAAVYAVLTGAIFTWLWPSASAAAPAMPALGG